MRTQCLLVLLVFTGAVAAQTSSPQDNTPKPPLAPAKAPPKKVKKVWTDDDMKSLHRGVSVVGEETSAAQAQETKTTAENTPLTEPIKSEDPGAPPATPGDPGCKTHSWAAAVNAVLGAQGVDLGRTHWLLKSFGGEICGSELGSLAVLASAIAGDYALGSGQKVRITVRLANGVPSAAALVAATRESHPYIFVWKGHPYVVDTVDFTDWHDGKGSHLYEINDINLVDPYLGERRIFRVKDREGRARQNNDLKEIEGAFDFVVTKR